MDLDDIVYADEAGMDDRDDYLYGWNEQCERFYALKTRQRQGRVNMIAAYCHHQRLQFCFEQWQRLR